MSYQRRRGLPVTFYRQKLVTDARNNEVLTVDYDAPITTTAAIFAQRSSKAEVPGQQEIDVVRLMVDWRLPDVDLWSRVVFMGREWDIAAPPAYHHGTRATRHLSVDIRKRPG